MERANFGVKDASYVASIALPVGAATVYTADFDLGLVSARGARLVECELLIEAPALPTGDLGDTHTMKYSVYHGAAAAPTTLLAGDVIVQTGAGGAGAVAATARFRLPTTCLRYLRVGATASNADDAHGESVTASLLF